MRKIKEIIFGLNVPEEKKEMYEEVKKAYYRFLSDKDDSDNGYFFLGAVYGLALTDVISVSDWNTISSEIDEKLDKAIEKEFAEIERLISEFACGL